MFLAAHRGTRLHAPENSLRALLSGYTAGGQAIEFDLQLSRDGAVVVNHDGTIARMTGLTATPSRPSLRVLDLDLDELVSLDISPGFAGFRDWPDFRYHHDPAHKVGLATFDEVMSALPTDIPKLIEIKYDSTIDTGRGEEMVDRVLETLAAHDAWDMCVLYALDQDVVRRVRRLAPHLPMCAFDYHVPADEQMALLDATGGDGLVLQLADVFNGDLTPTPLGRSLAERFEAGELRVGAVLYPYRGAGIPWIPTADEIAAMSDQRWIWSCAADSMIAVADHVWRKRKVLDTRFRGRHVETRHLSLGYAKRNQYAHVYQDDGVHVSLAPWDGKPPDPLDDAIERRVARLEEDMTYALKTWPFYSGGGLGVRDALVGDFVAEVAYEVREPMSQAFTLEMAVVNIDPGDHQAAWNDDGSRRFPTEFDTFFDPHGAPPYVGVEHDENDGYRINWNLGHAYENNRYGLPVGDGASPQGGRLRLERRGAYFSAYYRNDTLAPDWVCVGSVRNDSMNEAVFLRCVAKRWRQRSSAHPSGVAPIPHNCVTFRHLTIQTVRPRGIGGS